MIRVSDEFGSLQRLVDSLFRGSEQVTQIQLLVQAESVDLCEDLLEICHLVPSGSYGRRRLCDQINSSLVGHGWGSLYGTVE